MEIEWTCNTTTDVTTSAMTVYGDNGVMVMDENGITLVSPFAVNQMVFSSLAPSVSKCHYCGSRGGEDKYHKGTCANCGAIL